MNKIMLAIATAILSGIGLTIAMGIGLLVDSSYSIGEAMFTGMGVMLSVLAFLAFIDLVRSEE